MRIILGKTPLKVSKVLKRKKKPLRRPEEVPPGLFILFFLPFVAIGLRMEMSFLDPLHGAQLCSAKWAKAEMRDRKQWFAVLGCSKSRSNMISSYMDMNSRCRLTWLEVYILQPLHWSCNGLAIAVQICSHCSTRYPIYFVPRSFFVLHL